MRRGHRPPHRHGLGWLAALPGLLLALVSAVPARAQVAGDSTVTVVPTDTVAAPVVTPATAGAIGLPSPEFENYTIKESGTRYTATLTGIFTSGTVERIYFTTSHTGNFKLSPHWLLPVSATFSYGKQDAVLRERELLGLLTPTYQRGRLKYYLLGSAEQSNLRAIARRLVGGVGVGYTLYADTLKNEVSLSEFVLYEHTDYLGGLRRQVPRSSTRLRLRLAKGPAVLTGLAFYQPSLQNATGDYRVNLTSTLSVTLSRHLALTGAFTYSYESVAVENRAPGNSNLTVGFTYSAGK